MAGKAQQWEYCQLYMLGARIPTADSVPGARGAVAAESHFHLHIVSIGPDGTYVRRDLVKFEDLLPDNPFYKAIGLLGGAGWELISVDVDRGPMWTDEVQEILPYRVGVTPSSRTAYFKRPVAAGRPVDEPHITI